MNILEEWKDIIGYEGLYQISSLGRVKTIKTNKIRKLEKVRSGYLRVMLHKNNKPERFLVHRLVAEVFIDNPDKLPEVNHKDENKLNNKVENLEWCDRKYNCNYGTIRERKAETHFKRIRCLTTGEVFNSIIEAAEKYNVHPSGITHCCKGQQKTAGKCLINNEPLKWEYVEV